MSQPDKGYESLSRGRDFALFAKAIHFRGKYLRLALINKCRSGCQDITGKKVAFVVSRKVSKLAVKRNKLKRRLREIYRASYFLLPDGIWLMVIAFPEALNANFTDLKKDYNSICEDILSS